MQEIGQALDTPDDIIFDWLQEVSYPDQSFGRTILGPAEKVAKFARADLKAFVKDNYDGEPESHYSVILGDPPTLEDVERFLVPFTKERRPVQ